MFKVSVIVWRLNSQESRKIVSRESGDKSGWTPGGRIKETDRDVDVDRNVKEVRLQSEMRRVTVRLSYSLHYCLFIKVISF